MSTPLATLGTAPSSIQSQSKDILGDITQWPASFPKPELSTRVLTYVFDSKDNAKIDALVKYIKDTYPTAVLRLVKDKDGFTTATITQVGLPVPKSNTFSSDTSSETATADNSCFGYGNDSC